MTKKYRKAYIYKITNPKNNIYIGSTINLKDRIYRYKNAKLGRQIKIKNSILKYGWDNHTFEVIFECDEFNRNKYEAFYGEKFKVLEKNGLNLSLPKGDTPGYTMSELTKEKIGMYHKGKKISDKQKLEMSISLKETYKKNGHPRKGISPWNKGKDFLKGESNPMYGRRRSEDWKKNHSILMTKRNIKGENHTLSKIIYDTYSGVFYFSLRELCELINVKYSTYKSKLNGRLKNDTRYIYA
jgi:group I intron endonuclease